MDIDTYSVNYDSEFDSKLKIKLMVENQKNMFQLLVNDDDDDTYIPDFDFSYDICDCKNVDVRKKEFWDKIIKNEQPVVFTHTKDMFEKFKDYELLDHKFDSGSGAFAQMFYFIYRDYFWNKTNSKLIFLVSEEDSYNMINTVDFGMGILLMPIYMRKDCNKRDGENSFSKVYSKKEMKFDEE